MSVGDALSAARQDAGVSVEEVSRLTKIRSQLIRDIEAGNFASCGGPVYARGHIRAIAGALGIDDAPLITHFDTSQGAIQGPGVRDVFEREVIDMPHRHGANWTAAMAVAAAMLLVVALVSLFNSSGERPGLQATVTQSTPPPSSSPSPAATVVAPGPGTVGPDIASLNNPGAVFVRVRIVRDRSWVSVKADGKTVFGDTLSAGQFKDFRATKLIRLTIGNAGAVSLVVNGRDLGSPGGSGQVVKVEFGPGDPGSSSG